MRMLIQFENGIRSEMLLLAIAKNELRVVIPGVRDTVEISVRDGHWYDHKGGRIEVDAVIAIDGIDCSAFCADAFPRAARAGVL